jgi:hypothetical protein
LRAKPGKSSKSAALLVGKIIPATETRRFRNDWNGWSPRAVCTRKSKIGRLVMYIGLGGLLILILILWLLGVI